MDRIQFSESLDINPAIQVKNYFNEVMGMYNLFGEYDNVSIRGSVSDQSISFALSFKTEKEAKEMHKAVNGSRMPLYGEFYSIQSICDKKILTIQLILS